jgi:hypothetical protein
MKKVKSQTGVNYGGLAKWLSSAEPEIRQKALKWFVYLFAVAEKHFMETEKAELCNHWWHRKIDDERVVQDIMNDPEYYKTNPRKDISIIKK